MLCQQKQLLKQKIIRYKTCEITENYSSYAINSLHFRPLNSTMRILKCQCDKQTYFLAISKFNLKGCTISVAAMRRILIKALVIAWCWFHVSLQREVEGQTKGSEDETDSNTKRQGFWIWQQIAELATFSTKLSKRFLSTLTENILIQGKRKLKLSKKIDSLLNNSPLFQIW